MNNDLLDRYLADKATPEERVEVEAWLEDRPGMGLVAEVLVGREPVSFDIDEAWITAGRAADSHSYIRNGMAPRRFWGTLAAIAIVAIIGIITVRHNRAPSISYRSVATSTGERATVKLADGSSVILGPQSQLQYSADFGKKARDVILKGQALFTVVNNAGKPFTVHAGSTTTQVLGTAFSVRKYEDEADVRVAVAQGKVAFDNVILGTGDIGSRRVNARVEVTRDVNVAAMLAWADGKLVFDNTSIKSVIPELERWYGIKVLVTDQRLLEEPLVLTLSTETSSDAIRLIAKALGVSYKMNGRQVILESEH